MGYHHFHFDRQDPHSTAAALDTCILEGIKTQIFTGQVLVIAVQCYLCVISMKVDSWKLFLCRVFVIHQCVIRRPPAMSSQYKRPCIKFMSPIVLRRVRSYYLFTHPLACRGKQALQQRSCSYHMYGSERISCSVLGLGSHIDAMIFWLSTTKHDVSRDTPKKRSQISPKVFFHGFFSGHHRLSRSTFLGNRSGQPYLFSR